MGSWIGVAVLVHEDEAASVLPRHHVDIAVLGLLILPAGADFKIERGATALIDEMMPVRLARWKARSHPRRKGLPPGVSDERHLPLQDIDELILVRVPMPLRRPGAWRQGDKIDA